MSTEPAVGALVTPAILTYNEAPNIARALGGLTWAERVVVVDSGSCDGTEAIATRFRNVQWLVRPFDSHARQWEFALRAAGAFSPYVLALDADHQVPDAFVRELAAHFLGGDFAGGIAGFEYRIGGRALLGSVYPPRLVVVRADRVRVSQPGHTQELKVDGPIYRFRSRIVHDDRKSVDRFLRSQAEYSRLELARLERAGPARWRDRIRRAGLMPLAAGLVAYLRSGGPFRGAASLQYAYERMLFECLLALRVLREDSSPTAGPPSDRPST